MMNESTRHQLGMTLVRALTCEDREHERVTETRLTDIVICLTCVEAWAAALLARAETDCAHWLDVATAQTERAERAEALVARMADRLRQYHEALRDWHTPDEECARGNCSACELLNEAAYDQLGQRAAEESHE